ncbi:MAG: hypothetical protein C0522_10570, partial [Rhodocyclaceae bacterium]|nr:hypothetical protein [Rhodocyclaceae bacterium]
MGRNDCTPQKPSPFSLFSNDIIIPSAFSRRCRPGADSCCLRARPGSAHDRAGAGASERGRRTEAKRRTEGESTHRAAARTGTDAADPLPGAAGGNCRTAWQPQSLRVRLSRSGQEHARSAHRPARR